MNSSPKKVSTTTTPTTTEKTEKNEEISPISAEENTRGNIIFYCKNCKEIVSAERIGKKYQYKCPVCKEKDIAFGTERSIKNVYKL